MPVTIRCDHCGSALTRSPSHVRQQNFCSRACRASFLRKPDTEYRRIVRAAGHPIAPPGGMVQSYRLALYDHIGPGPHRCYWCARKVDWSPGNGTRGNALVVDHLDGDGHNNDIGNLVASCQPCNGTRGRRIQDGEPSVPIGKSRTRAIDRTCPVCGSTFYVPPSRLRQKGGRAGTYCSRACMYARNVTDR